MIKLKNMLIAVIAITSLTVGLTTSGFAGSFGVGVSGNMASVSAYGKETAGDAAGTETDGSVVDATAGNEFGFGAIYAEYSFGESERFTFGVEHVPGEADINNKQLTRTDASSGAYTAQDTGTLKANAQISGHTTYYVELAAANGLYVKAGIANVDIDVQQTNGASYGTYPDKTLDATTIGVGYKGSFGDNGVFKVEGYVTDYDTYKGTSTGGNSNTVSADLDLVGAKLAIGYKF